MVAAGRDETAVGSMTASRKVKLFVTRSRKQSNSYKVATAEIVVARESLLPPAPQVPSGTTAMVQHRGLRRITTSHGFELFCVILSANEVRLSERGASPKMSLSVSASCLLPFFCSTGIVEDSLRLSQIPPKSVILDRLTRTIPSDGKSLALS